MNIFDYTKPDIPDDCICNISPSQIYKFFDYPKIWYLENITKEESQFKGNTSSVLGTVCHYIYEQVALNKNVTRDFINEQLDELETKNKNTDIDYSLIKTLYPLISAEVVNNYVLTHKTSNIECEKKVCVEFRNKIYIAGTVDRIEGDCIVDYKNVSTKPNSETIPFMYKIQLLAYAYILRKLGYEINRIRIVYGIRPTKTIGARCIVVTENITSEFDKLINDTLNLITDSILAIKDNPKLTYLIFKSYDLKNKYKELQ